MGPQFNPCGRGFIQRAIRKAQKLQWGRSLIPAEGSFSQIPLTSWCGASMGPQFNPCGRPRRLLRLITLLPASMGPQFNPCGRSVLRRDADRTADASMGPQFNPCGRKQLNDYRTLVPALQWGRSLIPAEGWVVGKWLVS